MALPFDNQVIGLLESLLRILTSERITTPPMQALARRNVSSHLPQGRLYMPAVLGNTHIDFLDKA